MGLKVIGLEIEKADKPSARVTVVFDLNGKIAVHTVPLKDLTFITLSGAPSGEPAQGS